LCDSEYYYWEAIDCGTKTDRLPYVCERDVDDIGKDFFIKNVDSIIYSIIILIIFLSTQIILLI